MPFISSISGVRATQGDGLLPNVLANYVAAYISILPKGDIVVGRDGRPSGHWIEKLVAAVINSMGRNAIIIGMVPTPTVQLAVERFECAGGIAITASHNPWQWNGLKFLGADGTFLNGDKIAELNSRVGKDNMGYVADNVFGKVLYDYSMEEYHINNILNQEFVKNGNIEQALIKRNFKVAVDAVNASGSLIVPALLKLLGCQVVELFADGSGNFPHTPEPMPANLTELSKCVIDNNCDLGIAVDPDADRLVLIDDKGNPINEEYTIALAVKYLVENQQYFDSYNKCVVFNHSTSSAGKAIAEGKGFEVYYSPVGEINVVNMMKEKKAMIGGEGSGGVILPASHYGRDSLVGISLVLALIAQSGKSISQICEEIPKYTMIKDKIEFTEKLSNYVEKLDEVLLPAEKNTDDGLKYTYANSWVQIRTSNTEPIARIIAEAEDQEKAMDLLNKAKVVLVG